MVKESRSFSGNPCGVFMVRERAAFLGRLHLAAYNEWSGLRQSAVLGVRAVGGRKGLLTYSEMTALA